MAFCGFEYFEYMKSNHQDSLTSGNEAISYIADLHEVFKRMAPETAPERFCSIRKRGFVSNYNVTRMTRGPHLKWQSASQTYKDLLFFKTPFDLQLYSSLIWELRPATIIEFGSLQGGSALWLSDQQHAAGIDGQVHSFDLFSRAVHDTAKKPGRTFFHQIDLNNAEDIDETFFLDLPRPWLVIDDSHVNLENLIPKLARLMAVGDYYVLEDIFLYPANTKIDRLNRLVDSIETAGLVVDTKYTDAFGYNVTCAPNGWLKKRE